MEDDQILEELNHYLTSKRPNIIQVSLFSRFHGLSEEKIRSVMDNMSSCKEGEAVEGEAVEDKINKIYYISGLTHNAQLKNKVKVVRIVNEGEVERVKSTLESVIDCVLYGAYKGTTTNPAKLRLEQFEEETIRCCVTLPAAYSPDGNCRSSIVRPRVKIESDTSLASTSAVSVATADRSTATHSGSSSHGQSKRAVKGSTASKKPTNSKSQPKLFFGKSSVTSKRSAEDLTSTASCTESSVGKQEEVIVDKDSPSKSSDKENAAKEESKPKRSRVQMFTSSDESDTDILDSSSKSKKLNKKSGKEPATKSVINRTGLVLDPDDLQNESDEELSDAPSSNNKKRASQDCADDEKPKKRRRSRKKEMRGEADDDSQSYKKSKQSTSFGCVKAGEMCNSMKYVDKTYLDDEGFLVTEKVLEEVPLSERTTLTETGGEQQKKTTTKKVGPSTTTKKTKPVPKQQSSLLSFFKKK